MENTISSFKSIFFTQFKSDLKKYHETGWLHQARPAFLELDYRFKEFLKSIILSRGDKINGSVAIIPNIFESYYNEAMLGKEDSKYIGGYNLIANRIYQDTEFQKLFEIFNNFNGGFFEIETIMMEIRSGKVPTFSAAQKNDYSFRSLLFELERVSKDTKSAKLARIIKARHSYFEPFQEYELILFAEEFIEKVVTNQYHTKIHKVCADLLRATYIKCFGEIDELKKTVVFIDDDFLKELWRIIKQKTEIKIPLTSL